VNIFGFAAVRDGMRGCSATMDGLKNPAGGGIQHIYTGSSQPGRFNDFRHLG
jgi:hypothetical protein